ncbi:hypothetical protein SeMB42_g06278 [Synchytrium endobioticum]|uniref:Protein kinase domain-containing protein n=1 Tax=Synchytrium endobioticum TaxID=286115 RepID=A0A507CLQ7_9FUNG|nr:hypothetical protein SeMB42_g06278 [Synchytrium endobioticum]TPX40277.1 hypothetical protein SeLEV6574_g06704 [Synchytrium endobioticum]
MRTNTSIVNAAGSSGVKANVVSAFSDAATVDGPDASGDLSTTSHPFYHSNDVLTASPNTNASTSTASSHPRSKTSGSRHSQTSSHSHHSRSGSGAATPTRHGKLATVLDGVFDKLFNGLRRASASVSYGSPPTSSARGPTESTLDLSNESSLLACKQNPHYSSQPSLVITSNTSHVHTHHHLIAKPPLSDVSASPSVKESTSKFWRVKSVKPADINTVMQKDNGRSQPSASLPILATAPLSSATAEPAHPAIHHDPTKMLVFHSRPTASDNSTAPSLNRSASSMLMKAAFANTCPMVMSTFPRTASGGVRFGGTDETTPECAATAQTIRMGSSSTLTQMSISSSRQSLNIYDSPDLASSKSSLAILDPITAPHDLIPIAIQPVCDVAGKKIGKRSVPNISTRVQIHGGSLSSPKSAKSMSVSFSSGDIASSGPPSPSWKLSAADSPLSTQSSQSSMRLGKFLGSLTTRSRNSMSTLSVGLRDDSFSSSSSTESHLRLSIGDSINGSVSLLRTGSMSRGIRRREAVDSSHHGLPPASSPTQAAATIPTNNAGQRRHSSSDDVFSVQPQPSTWHQGPSCAYSASKLSLRRNPSVDLTPPAKKSGTRGLANSRSRSVGSSLNILADISTKRSSSKSHHVVETSTIYDRNESPVSLFTPTGEAETTQGKVNQYYIVRDIGSGAFGRVVLCRHEDTGVYYACKIISKSRLKKKFRWAHAGAPRRLPSADVAPPSATPTTPLPIPPVTSPVEPVDHLAVIKREIAILKKLSKHPNINALIEVLDDLSEDNLYMIFELCEYGPVMKILPGQVVRSFSEDMARKYFTDVVLGLEYLHYQRIIHRDIKPENLLLTLDHKVQIADFGISHMFQEGEDDPLLDNKNTSPLFSPPEACATDTKNIKGKAVDVWALGVTLYCFVHGCCPFEDLGIIELCRKITADEPIISRSLSPTLRDLLHRMLQKDPNQRISLQEIKVHPWVTLNGTCPMMPSEENCVAAEVTEEEVEQAFRPAAAMMFVSKLMSKLRGRKSKSRNSERSEKSLSSKASKPSRARSADILSRPMGGSNESVGSATLSSFNSINTASTEGLFQSSSPSRWTIGGSAQKLPSSAADGLRELPVPPLPPKPHPLLLASHGTRSRSFDQAMLGSLGLTVATGSSKVAPLTALPTQTRPRSGSADSATDQKPLFPPRSRANSSIMSHAKSSASMQMIREEH